MEVSTVVGCNPLMLVPVPQQNLLFDIRFKNCVKVRFFPNTPAYGVATLLPPSGWWLEAGQRDLNIQGSLQQGQVCSHWVCGQWGQLWLVAGDQSHDPGPQ